MWVAQTQTHGPFLVSVLNSAPEKHLLHTLATLSGRSLGHTVVLACGTKLLAGTFARQTQVVARVTRKFPFHWTLQYNAKHTPSG